MTWLTPVWPIAERLDLMIKADATLSALLKGKKVYNTAAAREGEVRPKPFVVVAQPTEVPQNYFKQRGHNTIYEIHIVGADSSVVTSVYNEIKRLFDHKKIPLTDHVMVRGYTEIVASFAEEDLTGDRAIVNYTVQSLVA